MSDLEERAADDLSFYHDLTSMNSLVVVVKSAIHVEREVIELLKAEVYDPAAFDKIDLTYHQRIHLAIAFGLDPRFLKPLKALGEIRNKFAHNLRPDIGKSDADNFYDAFSPEDKQVIQNTYAATRKRLLRQVRKPKAVSQLSPIDRFAFCATTLRSALIAARKQQVEGRQREQSA